MKPIIFVGTAQTIESPLHNLPAELRGIRQALDKLVEDDICELIERANLTLDELYEIFIRHGDRICIFHYAGHADQWELFLEDEKRKASSAHGDGLISFLAQQPALQLVFFNGCSTDQLAESLVGQGVPLVIGTIKPIADAVARKLAVQFYTALAGGNTILSAWKSATSIILTEYGTSSRSIYNFADAPQAAGTGQHPWRLFQRPEATLAKQLSLVSLSDQPLAFLPPIPDTIPWPDNPFPGLQPFQRKDARIFFGRSHTIWELYQTIQDTSIEPIVFLYGQSGVGKSSLLSAGLLPRLEEQYRIYQVRHQPKQTLLNNILQQMQAAEKETLATAWSRIEEQHQQPIILILDQLEELFNSPDTDGEKECKALLQTIREVFPPGQTQRPGKVILTYRKEVHADMTKARQELGMQARELILTPLKKEGIIEAVKSLDQDQLSDSAPRYRLDIHPELPPTIAFDLLEDKKSAIAPILQIILAQLWEGARQQDQAIRSLSVDAYLDLKQKAGDRSRLERYFLDQLEDLKAWNKEAIESGLVLDLLYFHTNTSASQQRTYSEILERYGDRQEQIEQLLDRIKAAYLMADNPNLGEGAEPAVVLIHDILAPLIRSQYEKSTRPGQLADRIFRNKIVPILNQFKKKKGSDSLVLEDVEDLLTKQELQTLEKGRPGMRTWDETADRIIAENRQYIQKLERTRRIQRWAILASAIFIILAGVWIGLAQQERRSNDLILDGQQLLPNNPTKAFEKMVAGWEIDNKDALKTNLIYQVYRENSFYDSTFQLTSVVREAAFSHNGHQVAIIRDLDQDWGIQIVDIHTGKAIDTLLGLTTAPKALVYAPNDQALAVRPFDRSIWQWTFGMRQAFRYLDPQQDSTTLNAMAYSPDGNWLAIAAEAPYLDLWRTDSRQLIQRIELPTPADFVHFTQDQLILTATREGELSLRDVDGIRQEELMFNKEPIIDISTSPQNNVIAIAGYSGTLFLVEPNTEKLVIRDSLVGPGLPIQSMSFSPNGQLLAATYQGDDEIWVWEVNGGRCLQSLKGHPAAVINTGFSATSDRLYSLDASGALLSWLLWPGLPSSLFSQTNVTNIPVSAVALTTDHQHALALMSTGLEPIRILGESTEAISDKLRQYPFKITAATWQPEKDWLATGDTEGQIVIWNRDNGAILDSLKIADEIASLDYSRDGRSLLLITRSADGASFQLWDTSSGSIQEVTQGGSFLNIGDLSPDGQRVAACDAEGQLHVFDIGTDQPATILPGSGIPDRVFFLPESDHLVVAYPDSSFLYSLEGEREYFCSGSVLDWSASGEYYLSTPADACQLQLWEADSHLLLRVWEPPSSEVADIYCLIHSARISNDDRYILSGHADGRILFWENDRPSLPAFLKQ